MIRAAPSSPAAGKEPNSQPDALLGWMDALADRVRLRLLHLLERQELGVVDLCDVLQLPQSTVSRHLKILSDQGWLHSRRQGTTHLYRTVSDELEPAARELWGLARQQTGHWVSLSQDGLRLERLLREKRERQGDSQAFFAGAAGQWDRLRGELYGQGFTSLAMLSLLPADAVVADLGCGTGQVVEALAGHVKQVIGVDDSPAMLKAARKRLEGHANVDLRRGDLAALPIEAGTCDAALLLLVLTYVPDPAAGVREMARVLKPGGKAVVVDLLPHDRGDFRREMEQRWAGFDPAEVQHWFAAAGLGPAACRPIPPEPAAKGPALFLATAVRDSSVAPLFHGI